VPKIKVSMKEDEKREIATAAEKLSLPLAAFIRVAALEKARDAA
jgi:uncharacterized protein (DUF1778 family)